MFGVLYTVAKEKNPSSLFISFRIGFEWLQLFLLMVNPDYGFTGWIDNENKVWQIVSFVQLNQFMTFRGYTFFLVLFYLMVIGTIFVVLLCYMVGKSFQNNRFDYVWPIKVLRWYSTIFFQVLDVMSFTLFLMSLDCQYFTTDVRLHFFNAEFPEVCECQCSASSYSVNSEVV